MSTGRPLTRRHLLVRGHVQGVGFRWFARETASEFGVVGWARNREDGAVEVEAEGLEEALDAYVLRLRSGNSAARVDEIEQRPAALAGGTSFEIR